MKHTITKKTLSTLVALSLSASFLTAGAAWPGQQQDGRQNGKQAGPDPGTADQKAEANMSAARNTPIVQAAKKVGPAVVGICNKPWYGLLQPDPAGGTGRWFRVIYSKDRLIATNNMWWPGPRKSW